MNKLSMRVIDEGHAIYSREVIDKLEKDNADMREFILDVALGGNTLWCEKARKFAAEHALAQKKLRKK